MTKCGHYIGKKTENVQSQKLRESGILRVLELKQRSIQ